MKTWILCGLLAFSSGASAGEVRSFMKVDAERAIVKIQTEDRQAVQAAAYADGAENEQFVRMLLEEPTSRLSLLRKQIEDHNCESEAARLDGWIDDCGIVEWTPAVQTSFARGGWMAAGAQYSFFVGFRHAGTGRMFDVTHMVVLQEDVTADVVEEMSPTGSLTKELSVVKILRLPTDYRILPIMQAQ